ncbi:MAG: TonB-dependent receptor [Sphingobium sp.]|jgi:iron complex outermembrane receptor protein|nr:TonB-dependent receptor [Sphingobium sp.]MCI1270226.1 TonB-dependent receptor [Sphingobium sp.]MCI1757271.1 TonB-dependent receptor [Sphingobium sp.]MCI2053320.1 TonB-dependent receptor [Sphingobium sp.]
MNIAHKAAAVSALAISIFLISAPAAAQEADAGSIPEIVVTATKRAESINTVPMSISAATGDDLVSAGVRSADDLGKIVPGFTFTQSAYSTPVYSLRGVGFYNYDIASTPTVTVYQDEAPLPFASMSRGASFDLERVEVLKGPQGLLFGSNSTGGAVNYIAARPTRELKAGLDAGYGRFDSWELGGFVSGPLSEAVGVRVAARHEGSGAWQRSATRPADRNGKRNFTQLRGLIDIAGGDKLKVALGVSAFWDKSDVQAAQMIQVNPLIPPFVDPRLAQLPLVTSDARVGDWTAGMNPKRDDRQWHVNGRIDYELSDAITLTSLTSYADYRQTDVVDPDATSLVLADTVDTGKITAFYQELRLSGEFGHGSRWIVGANYENNKVNEVQSLTSTNASGFAPFAIFFSLPIPDAIPLSSQQKFKNYAAFANVDLAVSDTITLHGGMRYTDTTDRFTGCTGNSANGSLAIGLGLLSQGNPAALGPNPVCTQLDANLQPTITSTKLSENNVSWRAGVDFKPNRDALIYANVSRGYKIGAFPLIPASSVSQYTPVTQESLTAYEAGFKLTLADRKVQLNGAAFYYDYRDKQTLGSVILTPNIFGPLNLLVNIPKSKVTGFELQAVVRPVAGLTLNGGITYVDSEIGNFTNFDPFGVVKNFKGEAFPNTPKWQWSLAADYNFPISAGLSGFVGANLSGRSSANAALGENAILDIDGYTLLDLRAGFGSADDRWKVSVWGRNVTDKYYWTNAYKIADTSARFAGMPATYGVTFSFRY